MQGVEGASAPAAAQAPLGPQQQEVERHWKELRLVTGVSAAIWKASHAAMQNIITSVVGGKRPRRGQLVAC